MSIAGATLWLLQVQLYVYVYCRCNPMSIAGATLCLLQVQPYVYCRCNCMLVVGDQGPTVDEAIDMNSRMNPAETTVVRVGAS